MNARLTLMVVWLSLTMVGLAHPPPPAKATSEDATYGTNNNKFMTPSLVATAVGSGTVVSNFTQNLNFSGKATFTSNVFLTMLSFATNKWDGPTNTLLLVTNLQKYITSTDINVTNVGGQTSTNFTWAAFVVSNSSAASITARMTASGTRLMGLGATNALTVPAGKEGFYLVGSWGMLTTNVWSWVQDQTLSAGVSVAAGTNGITATTNGSLVTLSFSGNVDTISALNAFLTNVYMGNLTVTNLYAGTLWATNFYGLTNTAPVAPLTNLFVLGTRYTNANQRAWISQCFTGTAVVTLSVEQGNGITNVAVDTEGQLDMIVSPLARYTFSTNGVGGTTIYTNTATWIGL